MENNKAKIKSFNKYLKTLVNMENIKPKIKNFNKYLKSLINMKIIKPIIKNFSKFLESLINQEFLIKKIKLSKNTTKKKIQISNFNKSLITLITCLFLYLFYLSMPTLYDKGVLQKDLTNKLLNEFKINISISSDITYSILPYPHFLIKNAKLYNDDKDNPRELSQIKKLKVFISQKNLFNLNKIKVKNLLIQESNFSIQRQDFKFFKNFFNNKFSKKKINIKNSLFFYKDINNELITIFSISDLNFFYDNKKADNQIFSYGEVFKIPFKFEWIKNFTKIETFNSLIKLDKINIIIKNESLRKEKNIVGKNLLTISNSSFTTNYEMNNNFLKFNSKDSRLKNNKINYNGQINFDPFIFTSKFNFEKIDLLKFFKSKTIIQELFLNNLLPNKNLSIYISINSNNLVKNKLFDQANFLLNVNNGKINIDDSQLISKKIGALKFFKSSLKMLDNDLTLQSKIVFEIVNDKQFNKSFQIQKKNRKPVNKIFFDFKYNLFNDSLVLSNFGINNMDENSSLIFDQVLSEYNNSENKKIKNWVNLKKFINEIFKVYEG